jgi:hypothetical protein
MTDTQESTLYAYIQAFETLDPEAGLPFYHLPSILVAHQGVFPVPDASMARALLSQFMAQLRSQFYLRTEVVDLTIRKLAASLQAIS